MNTQDVIKAAKVLVELETINGNSFVSIKGYTNKVGEVSNQVIQVNVNRTKKLEKDLETLNAFKVETLKGLTEEKFDIATAEKAHLELIVSLQKRLASPEEKEILRENNDATIRRSDAQIQAYDEISKYGMRYNFETEQLYIKGFKTFKETLIAGNYPIVKSQKKTIAKREIENTNELLDSAFRQFFLKEITEIKINGKVVKLK